MIISKLFVMMFFTAAAFAAPKIYSTLGDPLFATVSPTQTLANYQTFSHEAATFNAFVHDAQAAEKEGYWLDAHKASPDGKARAADYLKTLRELIKREKKISATIKTETMQVIEENKAGVYRAIRRTGHPIFRQDAQLRRAMSAYEGRLQVKEEKKVQKKKRARAKYLRSVNNLVGTWSGTTIKGRPVRYHFYGGSEITITRSTKRGLQMLKGTWKIDENTLTIDLETVTTTDSSGVEHSRDAKVTLLRTIKAIDSSRLRLYDAKRHEELLLVR